MQQSANAFGTERHGRVTSSDTQRKNAASGARLVDTTGARRHDLRGGIVGSSGDRWLREPAEAQRPARAREYTHQSGGADLSRAEDALKSGGPMDEVNQLAYLSRRHAQAGESRVAAALQPGAHLELDRLAGYLKDHPQQRVLPSRGHRILQRLRTILRGGSFASQRTQAVMR
jgi:hypothetical protein